MDAPSTATPVATSTVGTASGGEFLHVPSGGGEIGWLNGDVCTVEIGTPDPPSWDSRSRPSTRPTTRARS